MFKHVLFFLAMLVSLSLLNITFFSYDQNIQEIVGISFVATFFNWLINWQTSKRKSGED